MFDSRPKGRGFEPHQRHCVVSLSKNINPSLVLVQPRKTCPFIAEIFLMGRKDSNQTNKNIPHWWKSVAAQIVVMLIDIYYRFIGSRAILSGPAGGVVGYALTTYQKESDLPVIGFDMGGEC